ncbi:uncharacterized protein LOC104428623 isoform X3 [Eucalyptus grandis]|uniref:uncharacterized protein LOC104428623 isoform X3 n=1 Tax=Eucalyptus grandis TaxID=71139 RepID=UPI00192F0B66|nr:uncharacterized protein LOC104428623 isoform X3 [Eucalyptus grandis]
MNLLYILLFLSTTKIAMKIKLIFTKLWISFLRLPLPLDVYKEVLISLHLAVIPQLSNPNMFCDFLTRSYDVGVVVSVMALNSLFILMLQHGQEYPYFHEKLLVSCLKSPLLPAYLAAAFPKKLSRLAFSALPAGALVIIAPIRDLLQQHPSINCLVHRVPSLTKIAMKIKLMFTKLWISFLRLPLPLNLYKEVMVSLHQAVIPQLSNPIMFCDFLTRSYEIGGVVSVMGLSSVFILVMQHGLEYRSFFEKVLGSCLKSTLIPTFLAAAFAKKLSGLALSVLRLGALVIFVPIYSLFQQHSSINCLVHRVSSKRIATRSLLQSLLLLLVLRVPRAVGENGTASYYSPPYQRTECYGEGSSQFPVSNLFAAVGDGLWDMGAACGREYELRCISDAQSGPGGCKPGAGNIRVKVVDYALSVESSAVAPRQSVTGADLVLSQRAFEEIANPSVDSIRVEFKRL